MLYFLSFCIYFEFFMRLSCFSILFIISLDCFAASGDDDLSLRFLNSENYDSNNFGQVDNYSGNLLLSVKDIELKGSKNLDIVVNRAYNLHGTHVEEDYIVDYPNSYHFSELGLGWELLTAPKIFHNNPYHILEDIYGVPYTSDSVELVYLQNRFSDLCNNPIDGRSSIFIKYNDGKTEEFFKNIDGNILTHSNWKISCIAGNVKVTDPKGTIYDYGNIDTDRLIGSKYFRYPTMEETSQSVPPESETYMNVKKITNLYGDWISFNYEFFDDRFKGCYIPWTMPGSHDSQDLCNTNFNYSRRVKSINASDGRKLDFFYNKDSARLEKINLGEHEWKYNYLEGENLDGSADKILSKVTYPDGSAWKYGYFNPLRSDLYNQSRLDKKTFRRLNQIISPENGIVNYKYKLISKDYNEALVVASKETDLGNWIYSYNIERNKYRTSIVDGPKGRSVSKFTGPEYATSVLGVGEKTNNIVWRIGYPLEETDSLGNKNSYDWSQRLISNPSLYYFSSYFMTRDEHVWFADLSKKTITRDGGTYVTENQSYDTYGNPEKIIETGPNGENRTTIMTYFNDPVKWIIGKPKDEKTYNGQTLVGSITRNYDSNGNVLSENKDGIVNINTYDAQGNIATSVNANGATTTFSNYKRGIAQTEVQPEGVTITREVDNAGNVISETNGAGQKTSYTYDVLDRMTTITPPIGDKTTITYTPTSKTTTQGNLVEVVNYDGFGRPKDSTKGGIKTSYKYDAFDNKIFESYPEATIGTTFTYDVLNRVKTITNPDNTNQTYEYGKASTSITDERGKKTTYNYRSYGNPEEQHLMSITAPVADANVTLTRNGRDLVTTVKQKGLTRTYGYNSKYQLTSVDNPETGTTLLGRDNVGNMTSVKVGTAGITSLTYDGRNRNTGVTYPSGTAKVTKTYTKTDKLNSVSNTATLRKYTYDANDNLLTDALTLDSKTFTTTYAYNGKDQLSSIIYPQSGSVIDYVPDALGRPTKVGSYITSISYWPSGQFKQLNYANGTVSNYGQNTRLWPSSFDTKKGAVAHLNNNYTYDGVGNLLTIADSTDSNFNRTATYDDINRLITAQGQWGAGTLTYDGMGNITKQNFGSQVLDYVYNTTTNKLSSTSGSKLGTYSYDVLGNITSDGVNTYSYDAVPSLICAKCNDSSKRVDYSYDGLNKRVSVTKAGIKRYEILATNGDQLIEFIPSQNNKLTEYFYLGGKRIAQRISP